MQIFGISYRLSIKLKSERENMPTVYFRTVSQNELPLPGGVDEQYYLDLILNETVSCLNSNAIRYELVNNQSFPSDFINFRKTPVRSESVFLTLQMDSRETPQDTPEQIKILFKEADADSKRLAETFLENLSKIYSKQIITEPSPEEFVADMPSVTIILQQPLTLEDITWIRQNLDEISKQIIFTLDEYFGLPFVACTTKESGMPKSDESLRKRPNLNSEVVGSVEKNSKVNVLGQWEDWYAVESNNDLGYIQTKFIDL